MLWALVAAILFAGAWGAGVYYKWTPKYLKESKSVSAEEPLKNSLAGFTLGESLSSSELQSCAHSAAPCLWEIEEYEKVVLKKSVADANNQYQRLAGWDAEMSNYFRPRAAAGVVPQRVPKAGDRGPSEWFIVFDSDKPLGWRGLEVRAFTCNDQIQSVTLSVPLVADGRDSIAPLLNENPIFDLALQWYGRTDSTALRRVGFKDWAQPWNTEPLFKLLGQESNWFSPTHWVSYSWQEGGRPNFREKPRHTMHYITMSLPSKPCPSPAAVAEQEHEQAYMRKQQEALRKYKERDDKAVSNDNRLFQ